MAISLKRTGGISSNGVKLLVYGQAGAGKTSLIKTLPNPVVLSAEGGLLSIQDADLPYIEITSMETYVRLTAGCWNLITKALRWTASAKLLKFA